MDNFLKGLTTGAIVYLGLYLGGKVATNMCKVDEG